MPVQLHAVKPAALAVTIFTVPVQLNKVALQSLLPTLSRFDLESYSPTSEGGALLANQSLQKNLTVSPTSRQVVLPVSTWRQALDEAMQMLEATASSLPVPLYVAGRVVFTSHVPVSGDSAAAHLRKVFPAPSFSELGPAVTGIGVKVFLNGPLGHLVVEPLLADPTMLFIQMVQQTPQQASQLTNFRAFFEAEASYYEQNVQRFLHTFFEEGRQ